MDKVEYSMKTVKRMPVEQFSGIPWETKEIKALRRPFIWKPHIDSGMNEREFKLRDWQHITLWTNYKPTEEELKKKYKCRLIENIKMKKD